MQADDDTTLARLHQRLERDADTGELLDVAYRTIDSPVGTLLLAATTVGLVRVAYDVEDHDAVLAGLAESVSPRILRAPARLDTAARQLDEYFAKRRTAFDVPVDLRLAEGFRRNVIEHLRDIGYGQPRELRRRWPPPSATRAPCVPSAPPAPTTRCPSSSRAIAWSAPTARPGQYAGGPRHKVDAARPRGRLRE